MKREVNGKMEKYEKDYEYYIFPQASNNTIVFCGNKKSYAMYANM
jgi:hypothetical protein